MKTNVFIRSASSIKTTSNDKGEITGCEVSILVSDPDQLLKIRLSPEQIKTGAISYFSSQVGKEFECPVFYDYRTYRRKDNDRLTEFDGWFFGDLPVLANLSPAPSSSPSPAVKTEKDKF